MIQRFFRFIAAVIFCLSGLQLPALAQFEEGVSSTPNAHISGLDMTAGSTNTLTFASSAGEIRHKIKNVISLSINESSDIFPESSFSATVWVNVEAKKTLGGSVQTLPQQVFTITYDPATGVKYNSRSTYALDDYEQVKITVDHYDYTFDPSYGQWTANGLLDLVNEMRITRYYALSSNTTALTPSFNAVVNAADALTVSWVWSATAYNNISQLEWAWLEDDMAGFYTQNSVLNTTALFEANSTRVDLDYGQNLFKIPLLYPGPGKLYYRVRAAMRKNNGNLITGPWSAAQNAVFAGHQVNLNWQSSINFAENAKSKTLIQYFDGSLRSRQTVTKDNETGNTIVGETIYDLQGRPNIQILPTPAISTTIQYFADFNRFNGQTSAQDDPARFFDLSIAGTQCNGSPVVDTSRGNGRYYSLNNDWLASGEWKSSYLPKSFGFAYSETRFTDDATERVRSQGGVGKDHQIGSGHETKYFYGKPNQQELDAIFGTEVGDASHYSKNMVQDANGQMSVSYVDMHGRTIATAMAGASPSNLISIENPTDYPQPSGFLTNKLLTPATNIIKGNSIESSSAILVPFSTLYTFSYQLNPAILSKFSATLSQQVCFDCKYDLEISIRPEDCSNTTAVVKRYNNLQIVPANQACGTPMGFVGENITVPTNLISFSQTLGAGSWVVRKTLYINDSLFAIRRDSARKVFLVKTQQNIYDSVLAARSTLSGCSLPVNSTAPCDSCVARLGNYAQYKTKYLAAIGNPVGYDTSTLKAQYSQDSLSCADACGRSKNLSTLLNLRKQMLLDMIPFSGQYAIDSIRDPNTGIATALTSSNAQSVYNIFAVSPVVAGRTTPYFKLPVTETGTVSKYYTAENKIDSSLLDASGSSLLTGMTRDVFTNQFQSSWANSLIYYHPEFSKLKYAETNLVSTYSWLDNVQQTDTYAPAQTAGYLSPVTSDPYFVNNYVAADKTKIQQYLTSFLPGGANNATNNPSIWQLANSSILCTGSAASAQNSCLLGTTRTGLDSRITSTPDRDKVWQRFKSVYLSYRNEMVVNYVNSRPGVLSATAMTNLQNDKKQLLFVTAQGQANQSGAGMGAVWTKASSVVNTADTAGLGAAVNTYITSNNLNGDKCIAQRPLWAARLMQCEQLITVINRNTHADSVTVNTIINLILDSLVMVCHNSITPTQPYGATTTYPGFTGKPKTFEEVVKRVFANNNIKTNIADSNYYCNPFSIDAPKPYGTNPPLFVNYSSQIDSCGCSRFATLKQEAASAGYSNTSMVSMNQFLLLNYKDTLSLLLWQGMQNCSSMFTDTCLIGMARQEYLSGKGPDNASDYSNSLSPSAFACIVYTPIPLASVAAMPAFLSCGYQKPCMSCAQFTTYTTEFRTLYPAYNLVPYLSVGLTDAQYRQNSLWTRFMNYRTGFSMNTNDYLTAYSSCQNLTITSVCAFDKPLNDLSLYEQKDTLPCRQSRTQATFIAQLLFQKLKDSTIANFDSLYLAKCLGVQNTEQFYATYQPREYHYTLYYYDQAGNLVKTLPPGSVIPVYRQTYLDSVVNMRNQLTYIAPANNELLATNYRYNSLNQVIAQKTPDAGLSKFWYDRLGRLAISQNSKQITVNQYSYTQYDALGRMTEVGQRPQTTAMSQTISQNTATLQSWINNNTAGNKQQITISVYDIPYTALSVSGPNFSGLYQQNLRNRVSYSMVFDNASQIQNLSDGTIKGGNTATYYNYDIHGNVDTLLQDYGNSTDVPNKMNSTGNRFKKAVYSYDLISGKVNFLAYQPRQADQFYHQYSYDAENRLVTVNTSKDSLYWERDASYDYYRHGPLASTLLGQNQVQGISYTYTIQGWLKSANAIWWPIGSGGQYDPGGPSGFDPPNRASDVFGYSLNYYKGDFYPLYTDVAPLFNYELTDYSTSNPISPELFNGNIRSIVSHSPVGSTGDPFQYDIYAYKYDQLNRLKSSELYLPAFPYSSPTDPLSPVSVGLSSDLKEAINYDPDGNIMSNIRNGNTGSGGLLAMDSLTYQYEKNSAGRRASNKLRYVHDRVADANYTSDIDNQTSNSLATVLAEKSLSIASDNYQYDAIGNLIKDTKEGIINIVWTVYGKIQSITKTDGTAIGYTYDASGNRISKTITQAGVIKNTFYVRDASGNVLSIYTIDAAVNSGHLTQSETHLYGSSRLGIVKQDIDMEVVGSPAMVTFTRGNKFFELTNHLGNVLGTISDKKIAIGEFDPDDFLWHIVNYQADVISGTSSYAFGMPMPGKTYTLPNSSYRYGFNGKENDNEIKGEGNQQDYGMRIYDPRLGKFLSADPIQNQYPFLTPYQFASNSPISGIDRDGLEWAPPRDGNGYVDSKASIEMMHANSEAGIGFYESIKGTVVGLWNTVRHPINTVKGLGHAVAHPVSTGKAIKDNFINEYNTNPAKASGKLVGDIFQLVFGAELLKGTTIAKEGAAIADVLDLAKGITTRGLLEDFALSTKAYQGFKNVNIPGGLQNAFYDLADKAGNVVDVTSTAAKTLSASQFYKKLNNLATRIVDPGVNNRMLQIYVKEGQYTAEQVSSLSQKLDDFITDFKLQKTSFKITPIK